MDSCLWMVFVLFTMIVQIPCLTAKFLVSLFPLIYSSKNLFAGTDLFIGQLGCMTSGDPSFLSGLQQVRQSSLVLFVCVFFPSVFCVYEKLLLDNSLENLQNTRNTSFALKRMNQSLSTMSLTNVIGPSLEGL